VDGRPHARRILGELTTAATGTVPAMRDTIIVFIVGLILGYLLCRAGVFA
jgi:hypothetical protein